MYNNIEELIDHLGAFKNDDEFWMPVNRYRNDNGAITRTGEWDIVKCILEVIGDRCHVVPVEEGWEYSDFLTLPSKLLDDFNSGFAIKTYPNDKLQKNVRATRDVGGILEEFVCDQIFNPWLNNPIRLLVAKSAGGVV